MSHRSAIQRTVSTLVVGVLIPAQVMTTIPVAASDKPVASKPSPEPPKMKANRTLPKLAPIAPAQFSETPPDAEFRYIHVFDEPLIPIGATSPDENRALAKMLNTYRLSSDIENAAPVEQYLVLHPASPWRASLLTNLGMLYRRTGYFTKALAAWEEAWTLGKAETAAYPKAIADRALGELAELNARLGRYERLDALFAEVKERDVTGPAKEKLTGAREGRALMQKAPQSSFRCGPMAVDRILAYGKTSYKRDEKILKAESTIKGTTLVQVRDLANRVGLKMQIAKRGPDAHLVIPAVVHWKAGHFAALVAERDGRYLMQDPTFGNENWISPQAFEEESDGYFLIPAGTLPEGWAAVSDNEGKEIWGKGQAGNTNKKAQGRLCEVRSVGGQVCGGPPQRMASYTVNALLVSLHIWDTPVGYTPPVGPAVEMAVSYNQREAFQPSIPDYSNLGPNWTADWLSFVTDTPFDSSHTGASVYEAGGGEESYGGAFAGVGGTTRFIPGPRTQTFLVRTSDNPVTYERRYPDGSVDVYAKSDEGTTIRRIFLTKMIDPQGNFLTINYDTDNPLPPRITGITDAVGSVTKFYYENPSDPLKVTKIEDPFTPHRAAHFTYDGAGNLQKITDVIGIESSFAYGGGTTITSMTTPYGTTSFTHRDGGAIDRSIVITDPMGEVERVEYHDGVPYTAPVEPTPDGMGGDYPWWRDTFYWNKRTSASYPDWSQAENIHWLHDKDDSGIADDVVEYEQKPLERRVFYAYPGQALPYITGLMPQPSKVVRILDDGTTQLYQYEYNDQGHVTRAIDPLGRETQNIYDTNGIDLLQVKQKNGSGYDTLQTIVYNDQHEPLTVTDAAGQQTTYTYFDDGRLHTATDAKGETWTLSYTNKYLTSIEGPVAGVTMSVAWDDYGRPRTITNAESYAVTVDYDVLDRPLKVTYPNGTYEQAVYDRLHVSKVRDLLGRWTYVDVDALRRPVIVTDPAGQKTQLFWCGCGSLDQLIDPNGHVTSWVRDIQGRTVQKKDADSSATNYLYENTTSRLKSVTDAKNQTTTFAYLKDNRLSSVTHSAANTPNVSLEYDPVYGRVSKRTDGTGDTYYHYNAITGAVGAGRLHDVDGPWANDVIAYSYDELGRVTSRSIDGAANATSVTYDNLWRPSTVTNALDTFTYAYDGNTSRLSSVSSPNGPQRLFSYLGANPGDHQLSQILNKTGAGATLSKFNYTYTTDSGKSDNSIATWTQQAGTDPAKVYSFKYDAASRLTGALLQTVGAPQSMIHRYDYAYDSAGNRTSERIDDVVASALYNSDNELTGQQAGGTIGVEGTTDKNATVTVNGQAVASGTTAFSGTATVAGGTSNIVVAAKDGGGHVRTNTYSVTVSGSSGTLTYDANGNLTGDGTKTYEWDGEDRLTAINHHGTQRSEFKYDAFGRRVEIIERDNCSAGTCTTLTSDKKYLWIGKSIAEERNDTGGTGATTTRRFFGGGFKEGSNTYFYTKDHLGSIREVVDTAGAVRARYDYDPYGRRTKDTTITSPVDADFGYTGHFEHAPSGLKLTWFRAYDPNLGRWLSRDPIGLRGGLNLYGYVGGNPINYIDRYGLDMDSFLNYNSSQLADYSAGYGDAFLDSFKQPWQDPIFHLMTGGKAPTFGHTFRNTLGIDNVNECSEMYEGGTIVGDVSLVIIVVASLAVGDAEGIETGSTVPMTRVGRWMNATEYDAMVSTGRMMESSLKGVSSVSSPPDAAAWIKQTDGTHYVEFDVPSSVVKGAGGNSKIYGPSSVPYAKHYGITEMPPATNIKCTARK